MTRLTFETYLFVVRLVPTPELDDQSLQKEFTDVGELCVDDGHQRGVDVRESGRSELGLGHGLAKQAATANQVLLNQLANDDAQVPHVDLVDETVDGLFERFPGDALVSQRRLVRDLLLHQAQLGRWDVSPAGFRRQNILLLAFAWLGRG